MNQRFLGILSVVFFIAISIIIVLLVTVEIKDSKKTKSVSWEQIAALISEKECKPVDYWTICDDGLAIHRNGVMTDSSKAEVCGSHGAKDTRLFRFESRRMGYNWKVVVTPVNEKPKYILGIPKPKGPTPAIDLLTVPTTPTAMRIEHARIVGHERNTAADVLKAGATEAYLEVNDCSWHAGKNPREKALLVGPNSDGNCPNDYWKTVWDGGPNYRRDVVCVDREYVGDIY